MLKLDAHQHFWVFDKVRDGWITADMEVLRRTYLPCDLQPSLLENGINGSIAVQASQSVSETLFLLDLAAKASFIKGVVGWIDLCAADIEEQVGKLHSYAKLKGFRHILQDEPDDRYMLGAAFRNGLCCLQKFGYTFDLLIFPRHLPFAAELAKEFPELNFVIDHIAKPELQVIPETNWAAGMARMAAFKNVHCKISGLTTLENAGDRKACTSMLDHVINCFGTARIMYGSDWPVCLLSGTYKKGVQIAEEVISPFTGAEQEAFWSGNASRFYHINQSYGSATSA